MITYVIDRYFEPHSISDGCARNENLLFVAKCHVTLHVEKELTENKGNDGTKKHKQVRLNTGIARHKNPT